MPRPINCAYCAEYLGYDSEKDTLVCCAFIDGIPDDILRGEHDHTTPHEGDRGIQFESLDDYRAKRDRKLAQAEE